MLTLCFPLPIGSQGLMRMPTLTTCGRQRALSNSILVGPKGRLVTNPRHTQSTASGEGLLQHGHGRPSTPSLTSPKKTVKNVCAPVIYGPLQKKYNLRTERREQHFLTLSDMVIFQEQLWRKDWYNYKHERYRVQMAGANVLSSCTSGQVDEFFQP